MANHEIVQSPFDLQLLADPEADLDRRDAEWLRLYRQMTPRMAGFFRDRVEGPDPLDDLIAEIWRRAVLRIGSVRSADAVWSWLITIGANLLRDGWRADGRRAKRLGQRVAIEVATNDESIALRMAGDIIEPDRAHVVTQQVRAAVTDDEWRLLQLWAVEELTHDEITARLGLASPAASRKQVSRLCARLRQQLTAPDQEVL